jgi:hypothetical protein
VRPPKKLSLALRCNWDVTHSFLTNVASSWSLSIAFRKSHSHIVTTLYPASFSRASFLIVFSRRRNSAARPACRPNVMSGRRSTVRTHAKNNREIRKRCSSLRKTRPLANFPSGEFLVRLRCVRY